MTPPIIGRQHTRVRTHAPHTYGHTVRRDTCARAHRRGAGGPVQDDAGNALEGLTAAARANSTSLPLLLQAPLPPLPTVFRQVAGGGGLLSPLTPLLQLHKTPSESHPPRHAAPSQPPQSPCPACRVRAEAAAATKVDLKDKSSGSIWACRWLFAPSARRLLRRGQGSRRRRMRGSGMYQACCSSVPASVYSLRITCNDIRLWQLVLGGLSGVPAICYVS